MPNQNARWYREPTMLVVAGVLTFTLLSGTATVILSVQDRDVLTLSDSDYRAWKDEMRATAPALTSPPPAPAKEHD